MDMIADTFSGFKDTVQQRSRSTRLSDETRDKASASLCFLPGLYFNVNWNMASSPTQRRPVALSLAVDITYVNGLLSVYTVNGGP